MVSKKLYGYKRIRTSCKTGRGSCTGCRKCRSSVTIKAGEKQS